MFDRSSWISVLKSWSPFSSFEDKFFHIDWSKTLTDPHFIRWMLSFSYYSLIKSKKQDMNQKEMQKFTFFAIDRLKETISKYKMDRECGLNDRGILYTSHDKTERSNVDAKKEDQNHSCQNLDEDQMISIEPIISSWEDVPLRGDLFSGPNWMSANSEVFTQNLARYSEENFDTIFRFNTKVEDFEIDERTCFNGAKELKRIKKIYTERGYIDVDDKTEIIIAAGSWTPRILWKCGYFAPIYPMKGYSVSFDLSEKKLQELNSSFSGFHVPTRMIIDKKMYISRLGKNIRVTSIGEFCGWDTKPDAVVDKSFRDKGRKHVPNVADIFDNTPTRCGLRPQSADSVILLGRVDGMQNLSVNVGPGQTGWKLAIGAANLLSAILDDDTNGYPFDYETLSPKNKVVYAPFWSFISKLRWE